MAGGIAMLALAGGLIGLAVAPAFAEGTTYYVAENGNNSNDCLSAGAPCLTIQAAVNKAAVGDTVSIAAGTYAETVTVSKELTLDGVGVDTLITPPVGDGINGINITGSGRSATSRLVIRDLKVQGGVNGIYVANGVAAGGAISYLTFDNVTGTGSTGSSGAGLHFNNTATITDVIVDHSTFTLNTNAGIRISSSVPTFNGFTLRNSTLSQNVWAGLSYNPSATTTRDAFGFALSDLVVSGNGTGGNAAAHELSFAGFTGDLTMTRVTVTMSLPGHGHGIVFYGKDSSVLRAQWPAVGHIVLNDVEITGRSIRGALYFLRYSDVSNVSLTDVDVSEVITPSNWNQVNLDNSSAVAFPLGTTRLKTLKVGEAGGVDATQAIFERADGSVLDRTVLADNFDIEDAVQHAVDDPGSPYARGVVRWVAGKVFVTPNSYLGPSIAASIQRAVNAALTGDTVNVKAGTYAAADVHITKSLTLAGAGPTTIFDGAGTAALYVDADDVTIRDLTIEDGNQGIRLEDDGGSISGTTISSVTIQDNASHGIELHTGTIADLLVEDSTIERNLLGIRFASTALGEGITVRDSTFLDQTGDAHIYQEGDPDGDGPLDAVGYIDGLELTGNVLGGTVGYAAFYGENVSHASITGNEISVASVDFPLGMVFFPYETGTFGDITIEDNIFTGLTNRSLVLSAYAPVDLPFRVRGNSFSQVVDDMASWRGQVIDIGLLAGLAHADVSVRDNTVTLTGSTPSAPGNYGLLIRGDYDGVTVVGNTFDGGGVSGGGDSEVPPGAGIYVRTDDPDLGAPTTTSILRIGNNRIFGFVDGVTFYSAPGFGGLPAANAVAIAGNSLGGNSGAAVHNAPDADVDARANWWGCEQGPDVEALGCATTAGDVMTAPFIASFTMPVTPRAPGFWPATWTLGLAASTDPQTVPLGGSGVGAPSLGIQSSGNDAEITLSVPDKGDYAGATPFSLSGSSLIEIDATGVEGPFTVCFEGDRLTDELWHYEETSPDNFEWVRITWRLVPTPEESDPVQELDPDDFPATQVCGMTENLSPFAQASSKTTLTVTPVAKSVTYGTAAGSITFAYTIDGFLAGESEENTSGTYVGPVCSAPTYTASNHVGVLTGAITCSPGSADDYEFDTTAVADLTVTKAVLTVTPNAQSVAYGSSAPTYTFAVSGWKNGQTASTAQNYSPPSCTSAYATSDRATTTRTISCSAGSADDYSFTTTATAVLTVTKAALTVTPAPQEVTFGDPPPTYGFSVMGFQNGEAAGTAQNYSPPSCGSSYTQGASVGSYTITCSGGSADDYSFTTTATSTLTVTPLLLSAAETWYTGQLTYYTKGASSTTTQVTLTASITPDLPGDESTDECYGTSVADGTVRFLDKISGKVLASNVAIAEVGGDCEEGIATAYATLSTGQYFSESYVMVVEVSGSLSGSNDGVGRQSDTDLETMTVTVAIPPTSLPSGISVSADLAWLAGAGAGSLGSESSLTDVDTSMPVVVRAAFTYGKRVLPKGSATILLSAAGGDLYVIKTNSITSVVTSTSGSPRTASIYAKGNICRVTGMGCSTALDGNLSVRIDLVDGSPDKISVAVQSSKSSVLYYSNDWVKTGKAWASAWTTDSLPHYVNVNIASIA